MLWLSTKRSICHFNCATFRLPRVRSLHCPSKNFFFFFNANPLDRQHSQQVHGKRKGAQMKRQQFLSLDSQSISLSILTAFTVLLKIMLSFILAFPKWLSISDCIKQPCKEQPCILQRKINIFVFHLYSLDSGK